MNDCNSSHHEEMIAAAEERGRRRGVEERDRMHQTIAFLLSCVVSGEKLSDEEEAGIRAMLREGLAPRDSAPAFIEKLPRAADVDHIPDLDAPRDSGDVKHYDCALPEGSDTELPDGDG